MGIRLPGATTGLFDPNIVKQLIEVEKLPIDAAKRRRETIVAEKDEFAQVRDLVNGLDTTLNSLKNRTDFYKLKVESSHPDIIDGLVEGVALTGTYEFEVRGLAKAEKELAYGFPDKNETPVGFGFMLIEREDMDDFEVIIEPGSTLQDVATQINDAEAGVKAMVINTKYKPDPYRLLVVSEQSGNEAKVKIDEDTTFLEFKEQVRGRNLDVLFEDVPVTDEDNNLEELVDNVVFNVKRAEPGTRVQVNIVHDIEKTLESIVGFIEKYNELATFINDQYIIDADTNKAGILAGDSSTRTVMRRVQSAVGGSVSTGGKWNTLSQIGITTDPKTGRLDMNEAKVKQSLAEDYDSVADLFIQQRGSLGVAARMAEAIKGLRDPQGGVLKTKLRTMDAIIANQDKEIELKERALEKKTESIKRRFTALEGQLSGLKAQGDFLAQRFGQQDKGDKK
ncbi:flagellar filament capping protein FliD [Pseudobacteriovorax antillogorgiicola]|uniref:Flagellar hook-associated protein 2 n=1 Tax=Pseudobacteriovorax antillogorgiicola TaxID=1513793 RepID=A0A1Y6CBL4_9BACT|nr:flagellar filament capping protein FliD [Pseudobacteriovorax antillogorgiicola]TCS48633.1 flagellar capping protein FliD [Pseudobacteriovorax antillogorgiicola]SMF55338.1 Flagellar capping protein FliD [Pseudobacteriovorax antillogorgiicola]